MRTAEISVQNGQYRLSTLLLLLILLLIFGAVTVHGSPAVNDIIFRKIKEQKIVLPPGDSLKFNYQLINQCSNRHVQMKYGGKRGRVNARGRPSSNFTHLTFISLSGGIILVRGAETKKYLCFNRKGRLVLKHNYHKKRCAFREQVSRGDYIRLRSAEQPAWFVGFRPNGKPLPGYAIRNSRKEVCYDFLRKRLFNSRTNTNSPIQGIDMKKLLEIIQRGKANR
ncbi:hypothetical protein SNE40_008490 [Patella caerulea]|uniref:Uncharacterized protein n=1 Tax=Patella caerulea TaxID=87958 RepID=A0AAN8K5V7_PATCE